jgi:hypothetical protein
MEARDRIDARSTVMTRRHVPSRFEPPAPVITPLRVTLAIGLAIGLGLMGYALLVERGQDVPFLAAACAVLGLVLAAYAITGAVSTYRAAADGRGGKAFGLALLGGMAAVSAFGLLALATIFGLLWKGPS